VIFLGSTGAVDWFNDNGVGHVNEVTQRRARLVQRWVTLRGQAVLACTQPNRPTPSLLSSAGREISNGQRAVAVFCGREGNRWSGIALAVSHRLH